MDINLIKPYGKNAKEHPQKQIKQIANSIREFGFNQAIVVDKNNVIIVGHARLEAAKILGLTDVPVIQVDLDEEKAKAYRLADNKLNESDWDMDLVIEELKGLSPEMVDLTGFDRDLLIEPDEKDDIVPDNVPPVAKLGDLWALGRHRLMCGDSTQKEAVEALMGGNKADIVLSDPPYNVEYKGGSSNKKVRKDSYNDSWTKEKYIIFLTNVYRNAFEVSKGEASLMIWFASIKMREVMDGFEKGGWMARTLIVWNKLKAHYGALGAQYKHRFEPLWYCHKVGKSPKWFGPTNEVTVWDYEQSKINYLHPTMKPVELYVRAIKNHSKEDDIIYETFGGSGSTLIACEKTNRICYMAEIEPKYCDVIIKRWEDYVGNGAKATKLN